MHSVIVIKTRVNFIKILYVFFSFFSKRCIFNVTITGYQERCLLKWNEMDGVHVCVATNSIDNYGQTKQLIKQTSKTAPIGGIFHLAMVTVKKPMH